MRGHFEKRVCGSENCNIHPSLGGILCVGENIGQLFLCWWANVDEHHLLWVIVMGNLCWMGNGDVHPLLARKW